jgi:hypothetical protein
LVVPHYRRPSTLAAETLTIAGAPYNDAQRGAVSVTCPITGGKTLLDAIIVILTDRAIFARALEAHAADGVCATIYFQSESGPLGSAFCRVGDRQPSKKPAWNERVLSFQRSTSWPTSPANWRRPDARIIPRRGQGALWPPWNEEDITGLPVRDCKGGQARAEQCLTSAISAAPYAVTRMTKGIG